MLKSTFKISELLKICCCRKTTDLVTSTNSNHSKFAASLDNFSQELKNINTENKMMLEESNDHCQHLLSNLKNVSQDTNAWGEFTSVQMINFTNQQLLSLKDEREQFQYLQKVPIVICSLMQHPETSFIAEFVEGRKKFSVIVKTKLCFF